MAESNKKKGGRHVNEWVFYFDGDCGLCTKVVRWLSRTDFFDQIRWIPYQTLEEPPGGLSWDDLDTAAYLDPGQNRKIHQGFYAFRQLTLRLLPLLPLVPILWFPGVSLAGVVAYRWVARNRHRLSRCQIQILKSDR